MVICSLCRYGKELTHNNFQIVVAPIGAWIPEHCSSNSHRLGRWWSIQGSCQSESYYGSILKSTCCSLLVVYHVIMMKLPGYYSLFISGEINPPAR